MNFNHIYLLLGQTRNTGLIQEQLVIKKLCKKCGWFRVFNLKPVTKRKRVACKRFKNGKQVFDPFLRQIYVSGEKSQVSDTS